MLNSHAILTLTNLASRSADPEDKIWPISKARNLSEPVPLYALRELAGDWKILKEYLPAKSRNLVAFKPNDPKAPSRGNWGAIRQLARADGGCSRLPNGVGLVARSNNVSGVVVPNEIPFPNEISVNE